MSCWAEVVIPSAILLIVVWNVIASFCKLCVESKMYLRLKMYVLGTVRLKLFNFKMLVVLVRSFFLFGFSLSHVHKARFLFIKVPYKTCLRASRQVYMRDYCLPWLTAKQDFRCNFKITFNKTSIFINSGMLCVASGRPSLSAHLSSSRERFPQVALLFQTCALWRPSIHLLWNKTRRRGESKTIPTGTRCWWRWAVPSLVLGHGGNSHIIS